MRLASTRRERSHDDDYSHGKAVSWAGRASAHAMRCGGATLAPVRELGITHLLMSSGDNQRVVDAVVMEVGTGHHRRAGQVDQY